MSDDTKQDSQEDKAATENDESTETTTDTQQSNKGKVFTQEDVNRLIAKEKAAWKRAADREKETQTEAEKSLREQLTARDDVIKQNIALLKKDVGIDEEDWELTMADRDVLEQYQYLLKKVEKVSKEDGQIPRTPQGKKKQAEFKSNFNAGM